MTFEIDRLYASWGSGAEGYYRQGETLRVEIGALLGFGTRTVILESLAEGRGFIAGDKVIRPPRWIWTSKGYAVAK